MFQEKREEEDLPALKTALTHRYNDSKTIYKNTMEEMIITWKQKWKGKQLHGWFKRQINNIFHDKTCTRLRKGNFKRETESLLIAVQDNTLRINHIKARIDKTHQNSKCRLCGDRDEATNHIISELELVTWDEFLNEVALFNTLISKGMILIYIYLPLAMGN